MTLNIYYYMYECLKLIAFPRLSQLAKFSCNKSCGGVAGRIREGAVSFLFFFFFAAVVCSLFFFFAGSDSRGLSHRAEASSGVWTGSWS